jgi:monofunctional biosynthetic peptidoglycan transglycosylase
MLKSILLWFAYVLFLLALYDSFLPPISTLMMARTFTLRAIDRRFVPLEHLSPSLARAAIAAEDGKFCRHHGVDWDALGTAVKDVADDGEADHGASTITMQVTKNLFLWPGHSYLRKAIEIPLALILDTVWSKQHIMQSYLNIAEFGTGIFGAETAAQHYFHKSARNLTPREAALLAATLPSPKHRSPANPSAAMAGYTASIESRMWQQDTSCLR